MYNVSQNYINKIMSRSVTTTWYGTITTKSGVVYNITDRNIKLSGSKIASDAVSGDSIQIGTANAKQLTLQLYLEYNGTNYTINGVVVNRYDFFEAQVKLTFRLYLTANTYEDLIMPTFIVSDSKRASDLLTLTCFDYMRKFTRTVTVADNGTAYDMAMVACNACGVEMGMTRQELEAFTNGSITIFPYEANQYVKSGIGFLQYIGAFICACAYIGNDDKLYFKQYSMTTVRTITSSWRFSSSFADYETHYAGMEAKDLVEKRTISVSVTGDTGLKYNLGTNVFLQYGTVNEKQTRLQNILNKLNEITYTPFSVSTPIDPSLQVMDVLEFTDNQAVVGKKCCITSIEYNLNGRTSIKGVGDDPNIIGSETAIDTAISEIESQIDSKTIYFYNFTNANQIEIADGEEKEICNIRFVTTSSASVLFQLEALLETATTKDGIEYNDLIATVTYYLNELEWEDYNPVETWLDGEHMLHLFFPLDIQTASAQHLVVTLHCNGGSVIIKPRRIKSSLYGQSLAATDRWDGNITIRDDITQSAVGSAPGLVAVSLTDSADITLQTPIDIEFSTEITETDNLPSQPSITPVGLTEELEAVTNDE